MYSEEEDCDGRTLTDNTSATGVTGQTGATGVTGQTGATGAGSILTFKVN